MSQGLVKQYIVVNSDVNHDGQVIKPGGHVWLTDEQAKPLLDIRVIASRPPVSAESIDAEIAQRVQAKQEKRTGQVAVD